MDKYKGISHDRLTEILQGIKGISIGIIGDGCLDVYWEADMTMSKISRETPHYPLPVIQERMSPGGGANVAANLAHLGAKNVHMITVLGQDWRGDQLIRELEARNVQLSYSLRSKERITPAYCKPLRKGLSEVVYEDPRLDFENYSFISSEIEDKIIQNIEKLADEVDAFIIADQLHYGIITEGVRKSFEELGRKGKVIVADSRERIHLFRGVTVKPNEIEAVSAVFPGRDPRKASKDDWYAAAHKLYDITGGSVLMTQGDEGAIWIENGNDIIEIPTKSVEPPIDIVGAGDCFVSAFTCARAAGAAGAEAAYIANLAAAVVVKKIGTTGTASPEEILKRYKEVNNA